MRGREGGSHLLKDVDLGLLGGGGEGGGAERDVRDEREKKPDEIK